jgi:nifR3 family TIM-barrel protein
MRKMGYTYGLMELLDYLKNNPFVLAPMAGITDCAFRSFMREMGAGVVVTELVSATGLRFSSEKTKKLMQFNPDQHPIGVQIFGESLDDLVYAAQFIEQMGADFVDINFGCPVPKVVKKGAGSAALKDLDYLTQVVRTVKKSISIPLTIKIRTGWEQSSRNSHEVLKIAAGEGVTWVAIHGRTRAQGYSGTADWEYIRLVKAEAKIPVLGNGDITTAKQAISRLKESACDGVLIGRGALKNPWIFKEAMALISKEERTVIEKDFIKTFKNLRTHLESFFDERLVGLQLKKLSAWYSTGYPGSANFRKSIFQIADVKELEQAIFNYYETIQSTAQADTSSEPFLMGGHG